MLSLLSSWKLKLGGGSTHWCIRWCVKSTALENWFQESYGRRAMARVCDLTNDITSDQNDAADAETKTNSTLKYAPIDKQATSL